MRVNRAHNALYNSLNQAMQEPGFNTHYLEDMKLWVTHSQFIVEHINAMTTGPGAYDADPGSCPALSRIL